MEEEQVLPRWSQNNGGLNIRGWIRLEDGTTHPLLGQRRSHEERVGQDQVGPEELELAVSPPHGVGRLRAALRSCIRGSAARTGALQAAGTPARACSQQRGSPGLDQVDRERLLHADGVLPAPLLGLGHADLHPAQQVRVPLHLRAEEREGARSRGEQATRLT